MFHTAQVGITPSYDPIRVLLVLEKIQHQQIAARWNDKIQIWNRMLFSNGKSREWHTSGRGECFHLQQIFKLLFCLKHFLKCNYKLLAF